MVKERADSHDTKRLRSVEPLVFGAGPLQFAFLRMAIVAEVLDA